MLHAYGYRHLSFSEVGSRAAKAIIAAVGLDARTAVPEDLHTINGRFCCGNCPARMIVDDGNLSPQGRQVLTWYECIAHQMEMERKGDPYHETVPWVLLSPEAEAWVRCQEHPYPPSSDQIWSCLHCGVHCHNFVRRNTAVQHVKKEHGVASSIEGVDIFAYPGLNVDRSPRRPVHIPEENLEVGLECLKSKLWAGKAALMHHLNAKHEFDEPEQEWDWVEFKMTQS